MMTVDTSRMADGECSDWQWRNTVNTRPAPLEAAHAATSVGAEPAHEPTPRGPRRIPRRRPVRVWLLVSLAATVAAAAWVVAL